jgi:hypothetical protein
VYELSTTENTEDAAIVSQAEATVQDAMATMEEDLRNRADMQKEINLFIKITARKETSTAMQNDNLT